MHRVQTALAGGRDHFPVRVHAASLHAGSVEQREKFTAPAADIEHVGCSGKQRHIRPQLLANLIVGATKPIFEGDVLVVREVRKVRGVRAGLRTAGRRLRTADCRLPTAHCRLRSVACPREHLRRALEHGELRPHFRELAEQFVVPVKPRCRRCGEQSILALDERGDLLEEDDERGLETREGDFAFLVGERDDSVHHAVVEGALPREHGGQPAVDDTEPGLVRAGRRRQHRVGPRRDGAGRFVDRDERVVDRRQRVVVDALRFVGFLPQSIAVVHPPRLYPGRGMA